MQSATAAFLIILGVGQLMASAGQWYGLSLTGRRRAWGWLVGGLLLSGGVLLLPPGWAAWGWVPVAAPVAVALLLAGGSWIAPVPPPDESFFAASHPAHGGCRRVAIPDGDFVGPGLLLRPPPQVEPCSLAVCVVPGAGDTKTFFKWRLARALVAAGLTVLLIDLPGHGDYRHRPLAYPDGLSAIGAALRFLRAQPGVEQVGLLGISLGGAMALRALTDTQVAALVEALAVVATPIEVTYNRAMFYREVWRTFFRSPSLPLLQELTARQTRTTWRQGGYRSRHTTSELFALLEPVESLRRLSPGPLLLVYSRRDAVAPPAHAAAMRQAAPYADYLESTKASHVMLTLLPEMNQQIAGWLREISNRCGHRA